MAGPARRALALVTVALAAAVTAACGGSSSGGSATLEGTRALGAAALTTAAVAGGQADAGATSTAPTGRTTGPSAATRSTTSAAAPSDVTLGGASQVTASPGATTARSASTTVPIVAPTPAGYQRVSDPEGVVSVVVPTGWTVVPLDDKTLEQLANQSGAFPAETREQLQNAVAQAGEYMKILAVGPPDAAGASPNVNVVVVPGASPVSILKTVYPQQVQAFGGTVVSTEDITVDSRSAVRFVLELQAAGGKIRSTQVIVPADGRTVIISYANVPDAQIAPMLAAVVVPRR